MAGEERTLTGMELKKDNENGGRTGLQPVHGCGKEPAQEPRLQATNYDYGE